MPQNAISAFANLLRETEAQEQQVTNNLLLHFKSFSEAVGEKIDEYEANEIKHKNRFNVFDTLTRHHLEELHSNFIAYLLNPKEKHDFGTDFLEFFIEIVQETAVLHEETNDKIILPEIYLENLSKTSIKRELSIQEYGRLDIFIENPDFNIVIENKIRDTSKGNQIERYVKYCEKQKKSFWVFYLTPEGDAAGSANGKTYYRISYRDTILKWLKKCIEHCKEKNAPKVQHGIEFYDDILQKNILNIIDNQLLMNIKDLLKTNDDAKEILKHWGEIKLAVEAYEKELQAEFFTKVYKKLQEKNKLLLNRTSDITYILTKDKKIGSKGFQFEDATYDRLPNKRTACFVVEHDYNQIWFSIVGFDPTNDKDKVDFVKECMRDKLPYDLLSGPHWHVHKHFKPNNCSFLSPQNIYHLATNMDALVAQFTTEVEQFLTAWRETIAELNEKK